MTTSQKRAQGIVGCISAIAQYSARIAAIDAHNGKTADRDYHARARAELVSNIEKSEIRLADYLQHTYIAL